MTMQGAENFSASSDARRLPDPLISVIIPVHNSARTLERCIESVYSQTYQNWEILVIDSHSSDGTRTICLNRAARDTARFRYYKINDQFQSSKFNFGASQAKGDRFFLLGSDNYLSPTLFEECVQAAQSRFEATGVPVVNVMPSTYFGKCVAISVPPVGKNHYPNFVQRNAWFRLGGMTSGIPYVEDIDFYERFVSAGLALKDVRSLSQHDQKVSLKWMVHKSRYLTIGLFMLHEKREHNSLTGNRSVYFETLSGLLKRLTHNPVYVPGTIIVITIRVTTRALTRLGLIFGIRDP